MQHLQEFLNSVRIPVKDTLSLHCNITEKVDGCALQVVVTNGSISFYKRGYKPDVISKNPLTDIDILTNSTYYNAYTYLYNELNQADLNNVSILNFELFDNTHIISYTNKFKHNICLLSVYDDSSNKCDVSETENIANLIGVSSVSTFWNKPFTPNLINDIILHKDDIHYIWNTLTNVCNITDKINIEGLVLTFMNNEEVVRIVKLQNPLFQEKIINHLADEKHNKQSINLEYLYNMFITDKKIKGSTFIEKLFNVYYDIESRENDYSEDDFLVQKLPSVSNIEINNVLARHYCSKYNSDTIKYKNLLKFVLLVFRNKRTKNTLWCSPEYQSNVVNKFIDNLNN